MAFEVYIPRKRSLKRKPQPIVSLSRSSIVLNKLARAKIESSLLELAYDTEKKLIRIRPGNDQTGLPLQKTRIRAAGFFKEFGITQTGKFVAKYVELENALYVQL